MSSNISDVLKQLETISIESGIDVFIPSLQKTVKFKALNLKQQKGLLTSSIDESLTKLSFNSYFYNIIKDNILDTLDTNQLLTIDRSIIALNLRTKALESTALIQDKTIDLNKVVDNVPNVQIKNYPLESVIVDNNITVKVKAPSLGVDNDLNGFALSKKNQDSDFKVVIGELFVYELTKFITDININAGETPTVISFASTKVSDRIAIVEKLPSSVVNKVLDFIKNYRNLETLYLKVDDVTIDIDGSFFTV
jgi:hypothetical protein